MHGAVFLDRDGVINLRREDYVLRWDEFVFLPHALPSLARLAQLPLSIAVISNQSAVGRGLLTLPELEAIHRAMVAQIVGAGGRIDRIYVCPHRPEDKCSCRKPEPGLLIRAAKEMDLCLSRSYLVGDQDSDIQAARAVGCLGIKIGSEKTDKSWKGEQPDLLVLPGLAQAVDWICLAESEQRLTRHRD